MHLYAGSYLIAIKRLRNSFVYITGKRIKNPIFRCGETAKVFIWLFIELTGKAKPIVRIPDSSVFASIWRGRKLIFRSVPSLESLNGIRSNYFYVPGDKTFNKNRRCCFRYSYFLGFPGTYLSKLYAARKLLLAAFSARNP